MAYPEQFAANRNSNMKLANHPARRLPRHGSLLVESVAAMTLFAITIGIAASSVSQVYRQRQILLQRTLSHQALENALVLIDQEPQRLVADCGLRQGRSIRGGVRVSWKRQLGHYAVDGSSETHSG